MLALAPGALALEDAAPEDLGVCRGAAPCPEYDGGICDAFGVAPAADDEDAPLGGVGIALGGTVLDDWDRGSRKPARNSS